MKFEAKKIAAKSSSQRKRGGRSQLPLYCTTDRHAMVIISLLPLVTCKFSKS
jgi:hypothetical protein